GTGGLPTLNQIFVQRYDAQGQEDGPRQGASTQPAPDYRQKAVVSALDNDRFVVAWLDAVPPVSGGFITYNAFFQVFDETGPLASPTKLSNNDAGGATIELDTLANGGFAVAWDSFHTS